MSIVVGVIIQRFQSCSCGKLSTIVAHIAKWNDDDDDDVMLLSSPILPLLLAVVEAEAVDFLICRTRNNRSIRSFMIDDEKFGSVVLSRSTLSTCWCCWLTLFTDDDADEAFRATPLLRDDDAAALLFFDDDDEGADPVASWKTDRRDWKSDMVVCNNLQSVSGRVKSEVGVVGLEGSMFPSRITPSKNQ